MGLNFFCHQKKDPRSMEIFGLVGIRSGFCTSLILGGKVLLCTIKRGRIIGCNYIFIGTGACT